MRTVLLLAILLMAEAVSADAGSKLATDSEEKAIHGDGLVAHWRFDEDAGEMALDSGGGGFHGIIHHAERVAGRNGAGRALRFDGQRAWVDCGDDDALNLGQECTIEAWVRPEEPRLHNMTIVARGYRYRCRFNLQMGIPWDRSKLIFGVGAYQTHEKPIPFGEWSHVAGVCDGQRVATFVNGKLYSVRPFGAGFKPNETSLTIGKAMGAPNGGEFFKGVIDDVRLYNRVLPEYRLTGPTGADIYRANRTITSKGEWGGYEGFPSVCLTADNRLLVSFYAGRNHMDWPDPEFPKRGRICVMESNDFGATWSEARTIIDTAVGERDPSLAVLRDGTVICSYFQTVWYERGRVCEVRTLRSFDGGRTWETTPAVVPSPWFTSEQKAEVIRQAGPAAASASYERPIKEEWAAINATSVPVTELSNGNLLLPIYGHRTGTEYRCAVARSTDGGRTWSQTTQIPGSEHGTEPDVIELPGNRLLCVMRPEMSHSFSMDGGHTWTTPETGVFPRGHAPDLFLTSDGVLLCGIREQPHARTGVIISTDFGRTWSPPRLIGFAGGAYPSLAELPDGRIFSVHYQEALGGNLIQTTFRINRSSRTIEPDAP